ncbi:hypothetical protein OHB13_38145 (plasmid) [Streptomyces sp. NBC_00440]|uniref:hypothetical protein n=1 Tax=Streptomyces sp. NBC_00440 TaxID=2975741 RepID=UPI002E1D5C4D
MTMPSPPEPQVPKRPPGADDGPDGFCPDCATTRTGRYCEACGFDFGFGFDFASPEPGFVCPQFQLPARPLPDLDTSVESARAAVQRSSEPAIFDELITGGTVAASFTAAAAIAKAQIEATTQRRRNALDAETKRLEIESQERQGTLQQREETKRARITARSQVQHQAPEEGAG